MEGDTGLGRSSIGIVGLWGNWELRRDPSVCILDISGARDPEIRGMG
jgi:hypothetical protein